MTSSPAPSRARWRLSSVAAAAFGLALFAYTLRETGADEVVEGFRRVGAAFLVILLLSGLRLAARAWAWVLCTEQPHALRLRDTFPALVTGDALGNLTPLGLVVSEVTKAAFVRHRVSLMGALAGIAIENLFYTLTVAAVIGGGTLALLAVFEVPAALQVMSLAALAGMSAFIVVALALASGGLVLCAVLAWSGTGSGWLGPATLLAMVLAALLKMAAWRAAARMTPASDTPGALGLSGRARGVHALEAPSSSETWLQREMAYSIARKHALKLRRIAALLALAGLIAVVPGLLLGGAAGALFLTLAALAGLAAILVERWLFFAEARHKVTLYYGAERV
jgi:hypothetical protein